MRYFLKSGFSPLVMKCNTMLYFKCFDKFIAVRASLLVRRLFAAKNLISAGEYK